MILTSAGNSKRACSSVIPEMQVKSWVRCFSAIKPKTFWAMPPARLVRVGTPIGPGRLTRFSLRPLMCISKAPLVSRSSLLILPLPRWP
ncbi:hypothetical protein D9M73_277170 [compost metagenome]